MKVPFNDLKRIHSPLEEELYSTLRKVVDSNTFVLGKEVEDFEHAFAQYCGQPNRDHAAGISNGLNALTLTLRALDIGAGSEVIVPANTFNATAAAVRNAGALPKLVDCDPKTALIDITQIKDALTPRTKAIIPVHLYGQQANVEIIKDIVENKIYIIEDAAQAHGSFRKGLAPGKIGMAAAFSMYPGKNLGAFGDAGAVVSEDPELIKRIKCLRNYGQSAKYKHDTEGFNERLDNLQAAILNVKLPHLDQWNASRNRSACQLSEMLEGVGDLELPHVDTNNTHTYHLFVIKTGKRNELASHFKAKGIETGIHYPTPIHLQPAFAYLGYSRGNFPVSEDWAERGLSLPIFPFMTDNEILYICDQTKSFFK